MYNILSDIL